MPDLLPPVEPTTPTPPAAPPTPASGGPAPAGGPPQSPAPPAGAPQEPPASIAPDATKAFLETLPEDLREVPSLKRYSSPESLARAYVSLERTLGMEKVPIPKDENDTEAWDRYYAAGGRPPEPTQYQFEKPKPEELPQGVQWDQPMEDWWRQAAFESGLSQRQAQKLVNEYKNRFVANVQAQDSQAKTQDSQAKAILQRDWGSEYEARRQLANAAFAEMPEDLQNAMLAAGLNRMPSLAKYLVDKRMATLGETSLRPPGEPAGFSPAAIQGKIAEHRQKYNAALMDAHHPEHKLRLAELTALNEQLYREPTAA